MSEPLETARRRLSLSPPTHYHAVAGAQAAPWTRLAWA